MFMKEYVEIIGPCSKWVVGKGWVTQIPTHLILAAGFQKTTQETNSNVSQIPLDNEKEFSQIITAKKRSRANKKNLLLNNINKEK